MTGSGLTTPGGPSTASPRSSTPHPENAPWPDIHCVGAFEWAEADYWPSHVAPILVEVNEDGNWRRWRYEARTGAGIRLLGPLGGFTSPQAASFHAGGYLTCAPQRFGPRSQLLALPGPRLLVSERRRSAVRVLLREAVAHWRDRRVFVRCLRGIGNALAGD